MLRQADGVSLSLAQRRRAPLADAVERQNRRFLERTREKRAGGMALMMVEKNNRLAARAARLRRHAPANVQLLLQPNRNCFVELAKAQRRISNKRLQNPIELGQRLFIKGDVVQIVRSQPRLCQTVSDGLAWKARIMLHA